MGSTLFNLICYTVGATERVLITHRYSADKEGWYCAYVDNYMTCRKPNRPFFLVIDWIVSDCWKIDQHLLSETDPTKGCARSPPAPNAGLVPVITMWSPDPDGMKSRGLILPSSSSIDSASAEHCCFDYLANCIYPDSLTCIKSDGPKSCLSPVSMLTPCLASSTSSSAANR